MANAVPIDPRLQRRFAAHFTEMQDRLDEMVQARLFRDPILKRERTKAIELYTKAQLDRHCVFLLSLMSRIADERTAVSNEDGEDEEEEEGAEGKPENEGAEERPENERS